MRDRRLRRIAKLIRHEIERLTTHHTRRARSPRQRSNEGNTHVRIWMRLWPREQFEGQSEQTIPGQNGCPLVVRLPHRRLATPQRVVVHGREVVVRQRIAVDQFQSRGRRRGLGSRNPK